MTAAHVPITVAYGDGIGPEIMTACLRIMQAAGAALDIETIDIGEKTYLEGYSSGIKPEAWESIQRTRVLYKAPITTPQGGGYKSLNVTIRKTLGLYANVRPCTSYHPAIDTKHPLMKVTIIRENEEDLYAGIEHRQTQEVYQCLKLITRPGSEKIIRYAFEYARRNDRRKVSCFTKDNIMKLTDGLFHRIFDEVAQEYPDIEAEHMIVDIGAARLADRPEWFDVIVVPNLYGDILSDVAAQLTGSVGLGASANVGEVASMFEAIHGSAPDIAGKNIANPSGLLLAGAMMLVHIGQPEVAERVQNAWKRTIEEGIHTADIFQPELSKQKVSTEAFTDAVIERLGQRPRILRPVSFAHQAEAYHPLNLTPRPRAEKTLVGVDIFLDWDMDGRNPNKLGERLRACGESSGLQLLMITNRGQKVWPDGLPETFCTDHWRCRFIAATPGGTVAHHSIIQLLGQISAAGLDFIKTENLYNFDGQPGYSLGQGQ
jgi:isocitrate dehydrogenase